MKFQGLVFITLIGLSDIAVCQNGPSPDIDFLPPSPRKLDAGSSTASPLAPATSDAGASTNMEAELKQFRNELREFQALREEVSRNTKATDAATDNLSTHQRQELMDILAKLAKKSIARKSASQRPVREEPDPALSQPVPQPVAPAFPIESLDSAVSVDIADPFALGKVLFRSGDFIGAEKAFRKTVPSPENEMTLKYLIATCLRRQSKWPAAMEVYKAIAESNQDPVLRDLAKWQLDNIRWHQQSESQLDQLRQQRERRSEVGTVPSASKAGPRL